MRGFAGFAGAAGEGVSGVADRVMGENEQAEAFALLREQMPQFNLEVQTAWRTPPAPHLCHPAPHRLAPAPTLTLTFTLTLTA